MKKTLFILLSMLFTLTAPTVWASGPAQVLIIRHAEKPDSGEDLSPAGYARANALVNYFETNPKVTTYGTPVAIYAMGYDDGDKSSSRRAVETVTPLAQALGLTIHQDYLKNNTQPMVDEIESTKSYKGGMVLICWEHNVIPTIAAEFGAKDAPDSWSDDDYWSVWQLDFAHGVVAAFDIFSQFLMPGDPAH